MCCPWVKYMPLRFDGPQASNHQPAERIRTDTELMSRQGIDTVRSSVRRDILAAFCSVGDCHWVHEHAATCCWALRAPRSISGRGYKCTSVTDGMGGFDSAPNLRQLIVSHEHMWYLEKRLTGRTEGRLCSKWSHLLAFCFFYKSESIKPISY